MLAASTVAQMYVGACQNSEHPGLEGCMLMPAHHHFHQRSHVEYSSLSPAPFSIDRGMWTFVTSCMECSKSSPCLPVRSAPLNPCT